MTRLNNASIYYRVVDTVVGHMLLAMYLKIRVQSRFFSNLHRRSIITDSSDVTSHVDHCFIMKIHISGRYLLRKESISIENTNGKQQHVTGTYV